MISRRGFFGFLAAAPIAAPVAAKAALAESKYARGGIVSYTAEFSALGRVPLAYSGKLYGKPIRFTDWREFSLVEIDPDFDWIAVPGLEHVDRQDAVTVRPA